MIFCLLFEKVMNEIPKEQEVVGSMKVVYSDLNVYSELHPAAVRTAWSIQLIPLSCDLECVTHRVRDSFLSPAFHFSKSFHARGLILSTFLSVLKLFRETPETTYAERRMHPADMLFLFQELTFLHLD